MEVRDRPYVWVTWIAKLLSGEDLCVRSAWFKAKHQRSSSEKVPSDFNSATWNMNHTSALREYRSKLVGEGYQVYVENQNKFTYSGNTINVAVGGKPDLIARNGGAGKIVDIKTGAPKDFHTIQVQLYMWLIPRVLTAQHGGVEFDGLLVYNNHEVPIPANSVNQEFINSSIEMIKAIASLDEPETVPSLGECSCCDILPEHCPSRIDEDSKENQPDVEALF